MMNEAMREHLEQGILPFWEKLADEERGGYYGYVEHDLRVVKDAPKGSILNSRLLWVFSTAAHQLGESRYLPYARRAYDFMRHFEDESHGGLYWMCDRTGRPIDTRKNTYCQSFGIYGLAAYAQATGEKEPLDRALRLYELIENRLKDETGYLEGYTRDFTPMKDDAISDNMELMRQHRVATHTMNTYLHLMEAYTMLYRISGDERVKQSARGLLHDFVQKIYSPVNKRLECFFEPDFTSMVDVQSYGHDIEASWLMDETAELVCDADERARVAALTLELAHSVRERAYHGAGLDNERQNGRQDDSRVWWVQAEAVVGLANAWQKSGDAADLDAAEGVWHDIREHVIDPREGSEWFWSVSASGEVPPRPLVEPWKCPYHNSRMCLEIIRRGL